MRNPGTVPGSAGGSAGGSTGGSAGGVPPGWPPEVRPAGAPDWRLSATAWLLDQCPPEYRSHAVLVRHPLVLAWLCGRHAAAQAEAVRAALAGARADLAGAVDAPTVAALFEALEAERVRLIAVRRAVGLVEEALRGHRHVPRL